MKHSVEASTGVRYLEFKPIMYTTQVVAGLNYSIKVISLTEYHLKVHVFYVHHSNCPATIVQSHAVENPQSKVFLTKHTIYSVTPCLQLPLQVQVDPLVRNSCIIVNVFESLPTEELQLAYHLSSVQPEVPLDYDMTPLKP